MKIKIDPNETKNRIRRAFAFFMADLIRQSAKKMFNDFSGESRNNFKQNTEFFIQIYEEFLPRLYEFVDIYMRTGDFDHTDIDKLYTEFSNRCPTGMYTFEFAKVAIIELVASRIEQ